MMTRIGRSVIAVLLFYAALSAHAVTQRPRTMAFVVGIEHYTDGDLDKLQYAADDARKFYDQLKVLTDLVPEGDTSVPHSVLLTADDDQNTIVTADQIRTALQLFVTSIRDNINVIVYLGGHGTASPSGTLWYLPSNYDRDNQLNHFKWAEVMTMFRESMNGELRAKVNVTFFLNMCSAGNALSQGNLVAQSSHNEKLLEVVRNVVKDQPLGLQNYSIIPAAGIDQIAFEDPDKKSSLYAYHLIGGMKGPAAEGGKITTLGLLKHLETMLGKDLPRNEKFTNIPIGDTQELEGKADYLAGTALLAAAQALAADGPDDEMLVHRQMLLELASQYFADVADRAPGLALRSLLRQAQTRLLRGQPIAELANADALKSATTEPEAAELKKLIEPEMERKPFTLRQLRDSLAGGPFYVIVLDTQSSPSQRPDPANDFWIRTMRELGARDTASGIIQIRLPETGIPPEITATVNRWAAEQDATGSTARLIVVYSGSAGLEENDLRPFGTREIQDLASRWRGPMTLFYLGPYGGYLAKATPPRRQISLLLAAQELNGMTFSGDTSSTSIAIGTAFVEGAEPLTEHPRYREYATAVDEIIGRFNRPDLVVGTPAWLPEWTPGDTAVLPSSVATGPTGRFVFHLASGCAQGDMTACDDKVLAQYGIAGAGGSRVDPFAVLTAAAQSDLAGNIAQALQQYESAAKVLREAVPATVGDLVSTATGQSLKAAAATAERRAATGRNPAARRALIVRVAIKDYKSPWIADLPDASADMAAYTTAFTTALAGKAEVVPVDVAAPATANELLDLLRREHVRATTHDLIVFIYSGRGVESGGRRYLTTAGTQPCVEAANLAANTAEVNCDDDTWTELVDLWDVAETMKGRWFVSFYDAQFTTPVADSDRTNQVLDKHLHSVRPILPTSEELDAVTATAADQSSGLAIRPRGALPQEQLHLWVEGTLTAESSTDCVDQPMTSRLAAAVATNLPGDKPSTYREWLTRLAASPCFEEEFSEGVSDLRLVAQGDADLPLFASGEGADVVDLMRNDHVRHEANLRAAHAVLASSLGEFKNNRNRLSGAAVLLALALHESQRTRGAKAGDEWLREAAQLLASVERGGLATPEGLPIEAMRVELFARTYALGGDPNRARSSLRETGPSVLSQRRLAERLVKMTDEAARRQPNTLMIDTRDYLLQAAKGVPPTNASDMATARARIEALIREEKARRAEPYVIEPPPASQQPVKRPLGLG